MCDLATIGYYIILSCSFFSLPAHEFKVGDKASWCSAEQGWYVIPKKDTQSIPPEGCRSGSMVITDYYRKYQRCQFKETMQKKEECHQALNKESLRRVRPARPTAKKD